MHRMINFVSTLWLQVVHVSNITKHLYKNGKYGFNTHNNEVNNENALPVNGVFVNSLCNCVSKVEE